MTATTRILGIDPGSQVTGFGIIDVSGTRAVAVDWGDIRTSGDHSARLREIFLGLGAVVARFAPAEISIERVFISRNADSALKLGQARAAALCATFGHEIPIHEYSARHIKKAVVGRGAADKTQVQHMVRMLLGLHEAVAPDAADALAAALCHAHSRAAQSAITRTVAQ